MKKQLLILGCAILACTAVVAQPIGWTYVQPITITNNAGTPATDIQVKITLDTQTPIGMGQMLSNGNDIRFGKNCAGTILFNYWIESGINTTNTQIWVKLDSLNASETRTFYLYYGNNAAPAASAVTGTFIGPHSSTDSVASGGAGGVGNSQRGFRFAPNTDILLYAFGKREPTGTTRYVTLFNFTTQAILLQTQVSGPAGQYSYAPVPSPMWLTQGTQYTIQLFQGASDGYYFGTSSQIGQHLTYGDMRYCNSCTQNTFPTNVLTNYHYGYPDFWYFTKNTLPLIPTITPGSTLDASIASVPAICVGDSASLVGSANGGGGGYTYLWSPPTGLSNISIANPMAAPATTTMYYLTATDACGASNTDSVLVTVNPLPVVTLSGNTSICNGDSTLLTGTSGGSSQWYLNGSPIPSGTNNTFFASQPGVYNMVQTLNGCSDSAATGITMTLITPPVVTATTTADSICAGSSVTLTGSGANSYSWSGGVTDGVPFTPVSSGTYTVTGTDSGTGCTATATVTVDVLALPNVSGTASANPVCIGSPVTLSGSGAMTYTWDNNVIDGVSFNAPASTTTYMVTGTDMYGCQDTALFTLTVNPAPPVSANANPASVCNGNSVTLTGSGAQTYTWSNNVTNGVAFVPSGTTTYTVTGTDANGCQATDTITVSVTPGPTVNIGNDVNSCSGSVLLNAQNSGSSYLWSNGSTGQTLTVTTSGVYWVTVTDVNGCVTTDSANVSVFTGPTATLSATDNSVCIDDANVTLTGAPGGGVLLGAGVTGNSFDPTVAGIGTQLITYIYTDLNGCSDTTTTAIVVSACVGITEQVSGIANVYPNPATDLVTIAWTKTVKTRIRAFDISGKLVYDEMHNGVTRAQVNVNTWPAGTYSFRIEQGNGFETVLVEKR